MYIHQVEKKKKMQNTSLLFHNKLFINSNLKTTEFLEQAFNRKPAFKLVYLVAIVFFFQFMIKMSNLQNYK